MEKPLSWRRRLGRLAPAIGLGLGLAWAGTAVVPGGIGLPFVHAHTEQGDAQGTGESVPAGEHPFDANVRVTTQGDALVVASDGIPTHKTGTFPNATNPNRILRQNYRFYIPRHPQKAEKTTETPFGPIGVAINGIPFYNPYNAQGRDAVLGPFAEVFDSCCGHPDPMGRYHYHKYPECVKTPFHDPEGQHSPLIGLMFDGFALYGPNGETGEPPSDLDKCNGHEDAVRGYHYHVTATYPYIIGAYRGTPDPRNLDRPRFPGRNGPLAFEGPGRRDDLPPPPHPLEVALDTDRDGELSSDEVARVAEGLKALDLDKDGQLVENELIPSRVHPPGGGGDERGRPLAVFAAADERRERSGDSPPPPPPPGRGRRRGESLRDRDRGPREPDEPPDGPPPREGRGRRGEARDRGPRDFDGPPDGPPPPGEERGRRGEARDRGPREFDGPPEGPPPPPPGGRPRFPGFGRGPGGPLSPPPPPPPSPLLVALDRDRDGVLSSKEIAAASEALKELDRNGDGKLSRDELRPPRPRGPRPPGFGRPEPDRDGPPPPPPREGRGPRNPGRPRLDRGGPDRDEPPPPRDRRPDGDRPPPPRDRDAEEASH